GVPCAGDRRRATFRGTAGVSGRDLGRRRAPGWPASGRRRQQDLHGVAGPGRARCAGHRPKLGTGGLMSRLIMVGVSHHGALLEVRERLAVDEAAWRASAPASFSTVLLSTCNRVELYAWVDDRPSR